MRIISGGRAPFPFVPACFVLILVTGMTFLCYLGAQAIYDGYVGSARWQSVSADVIASGAKRGCGKGGRGYFVNMQYRYVIDGVGYLNRQIQFGPEPCGQEAEIVAIAARWPAGSSPTVFVDPAHPAQSVLLREVAPFTWWLTLILFVMVSAMACLLVFVVRRYRRATGKLGWG
jgi:Protein of unknown function (DUF3592)